MRAQVRCKGGTTCARGNKGTRRSNGGQHPRPLAYKPQPGLSYALPSAFFAALGLPRLISYNRTTRRTIRPSKTSTSQSATLDTRSTRGFRS